MFGAGSVLAILRVVLLDIFAMLILKQDKVMFMIFVLVKIL